MGKKRKSLEDIIVHAYECFTREKKTGSLIYKLDNPMARTCYALGISRHSVYRAIGKQKQSHTKKALETVQPAEIRHADVQPAEIQPAETLPDNDAHTHRKGRKSKLDEFDLSAIRAKVRTKFDKGEMVTLAELKAEIGLNVDKSTIGRALKKMKFSFKREGNDLYVRERPNVVQLRHKYLRRIRKIRRDNVQPAYQDETWLDYSHKYKNKGEWLDPEGRGRKKASVSTSGRWVIVDSGDQDGPLNGALLMYESQKTGDYHGEFNGEKFMRYVKDQLLPSLKPGQPLIVDNASYHSVMTEGSKVPTKGSRKQEMVDWLTSKGIEHEEGETKEKLYKKIALNKPEKEFEFDQFMREKGHDVIRLPPYHSDLNPIELSWAFQKGYVERKKTASSNAKDVRRLFEEAREIIKEKGMWKNFEKKVIEEEEKYWKTDGVSEDLVDRIVVNLEESDAEPEDESDMEDGTDDACCVCLKKDIPGKKEKWFGCDKCDLWYHGVCLMEKDMSIAQKSIKLNKKWFCQLCLVTNTKLKNNVVLIEEEEEE